MKDLFDSGVSRTGARFSKDRKYRFWLYRIWNDDFPKIMFIGLNPSTADESQNDHTIRRVIGFARNWGYGGIYMLNLFAYVSTDPKKLLVSGEDLSINNRYLRFAGRYSQDVLFAWGTFKQAKLRADEVIGMFPNAICLNKNKDGSPVHPLYQPLSTRPKKFNQ